MKIVFMGTPDFAVNTLEALIKAGHEIALVVTQPDKAKGRGKKLVYSAVKESALGHGLLVAQPEKVRDEEFVEKLRKIAPEVIVVVAFGQILPESILSMPKFGCVNVHASLLPEYRGAAPIQWAVIDGLEKTGVTTMYMDKGLDTGDIIEQRTIDIAPDETGGSLFDKLAVLGGEIIVDTLDSLEKGTASRTPQDNNKSSYAKMLNKDMGHIDFNEDAAKIERLIRGLNPWPSAYTSIDGKMLKIYRATVEDDENLTVVKPGTVIAVDKKSFTVCCGKGTLKILNLQLEGKKRMDTDAFLRGYEVKEGAVLV